MKLPLGVRACLWSYRPSIVDVRRDRALIITQVLNYGRWDDVQWLLQTYTRGEISKVLCRPARGSWLPDVLHFWTLLWKIRLPRKVYRQALFSVHPSIERQKSIIRSA